jgi:transposase
MRPITRQARTVILDLLKTGKSTRKIAEVVHVDQKTVCNVRRESGVALPAVPRGRPRALTAKTERFIERNVELRRVLTASDTRRHLIGHELINVSDNTVCRAFSRRKLHARIQRKVPMLTREHMHQRLDFAKKFKSWTFENWKRVIWSDETKICVFGSEGRRYYWKRRGSPMLNHHFRPTKKFGGGAIFLWGCIA